MAVECARATRMHLFATNITKSLRADEFEQLQKTAADGAATQLREAWSVTLRHSVRSAFRDAGKGAYNLREKDLDGYNASKLRRFLTAARYRQEDSLRILVRPPPPPAAPARPFPSDPTLSSGPRPSAPPDPPPHPIWQVESSCARFVSYLEKRLAPPTAINSPSDVVNPTLDDSDGAPPPPGSAPAKRAPLFALEVAVTPAFEFRFASEPEAFEKLTLALFDQAVSKVSGIPQLASCVMDALSWNPVPLIAAPKADEPEIVALVSRLRSALAAAVAAANKYIGLLAVYSPVLAFDSKAYIAAIESNEEFTLFEFKKEIDAHSAELAAIRSAVPAVQSVGPFLVDTAKALAALVAKKEAVVEALKGVLAKRPATMCERITAKFKDMDRRIQAKPADPEELKEQRELIQGVPKFCAEMMAALQDSTPFFDAMDEMRIPMSDISVDAKTAAQFWPTRIANTVAAVEEALAADENRYRSEQKEAQNDFERRLVDLAGAVNTLQTNTDLSKIA